MQTYCGSVFYPTNTHGSTEVEIFVIARSSGRPLRLTVWRLAYETFQTVSEPWVTCTYQHAQDLIKFKYWH
jgi:hypothetical protein